MRVGQGRLGIKKKLEQTAGEEGGRADAGTPRLSVPSWPLTLGMRMPGWFDLSTLDKLTDSRHDDEKGLLTSVAAIDALVQAELDAGIPENKIIVGGFSQGGAVAMLYGLTSGRKLAGVAALSTWVVLNHKVMEVSGVWCGSIAIWKWLLWLSLCLLLRGVFRLGLRSSIRRDSRTTPAGERATEGDVAWEGGPERDTDKPQRCQLGLRHSQPSPAGRSTGRLRSYGLMSMRDRHTRASFRNLHQIPLSDLLACITHADR